MALKPIETWIPVEISEGAFSSEYAITIKCFDGREVSLFADKNQIKLKNNQAYLLVTLISNNQKENKQTVLLPTETFETSSRWVEIYKK
jgi:hypothetical protein